MVAPIINPLPLRDLAQSAISASAALTAACTAGRAISDAQYARIDHVAYAARQQLLACLEHDHGIDAAMAEQLGALL
jgi:hypothetical protein